jgi:hypothetical protein
MPQKSLKESLMAKNRKMRNLFMVLFCLMVISACSTTEEGKVLAGPAPNFISRTFPENLSP